jgi:tungstate transport system ATP-binding protein
MTLRGVTLDRDGTRLLSGVDLDIVPRERLLVLGPNGAGKTLLMHVGHRLIAPTQGHLETAGRLREAMVFQRPVLLRRSVIGNVLYAVDHAHLGARRHDGERREARALAALRLVGLEALAHRQARVLSGGEQQRVALARAAALRPDLVWLDEPTANLDPASTQAIESIVMRMSAEGATCVMSTHDIGQARRLAQRVVLMAGGRIIESTDAARFFEEPATEAGRRYLRGELLNG